MIFIKSHNRVVFIGQMSQNTARETIIITYIYDATYVLFEFHLKSLSTLKRLPCLYLQVKLVTKCRLILNKIPLLMAHNYIHVLPVNENEME